MPRKPAKPASPRRWPMSETEKMAVHACLAQIDAVHARLGAVWHDASRRLGVPESVSAQIDPKGGAWVEAGKGG